MSTKNDELLVIRRYRNEPSLGALLGVEIKKHLDEAVGIKLKDKTVMSYITV